MLKLKSYKELPIGGVILATPERAKKKTGDWRSEKPVLYPDACINCLLCWVRCPDTAILIEDQQMKGFDYDHCKGCGICAHTCPSDAIEMVDDAQEVPPLGRIEGREQHGSD